MTQKASGLLYKVFSYSIALGFVVSAAIAPFHVFFAIKTGCIPEILPNILYWAASNCGSPDFYTSPAYWWGLVVRLVFSIPAVLLVLLGIMYIRKKWAGPQAASEQPDPSVAAIIAALRQVTSESPKGRKPE